MQLLYVDNVVAESKLSLLCHAAYRFICTVV